MNQINRSLFIKSLNRLRVQHFGGDPLKLFETTPETGETFFLELAADWSGRRVESSTDSEKEFAFWQFQIAAPDDWQTSQSYMSKIVSFKIGSRRWKVKKVEKPVGNAKVWKIKAEIQ